jgi:excisionase family DNA binding protein
MSYLTPEETAQQLRVEVPDVMSLIEQGKLRAIRIGDNIRIRQTELERLEVTCAAAPTAGAGEDAGASLTTEAVKLPAGQRWIVTRSGRAKFRALGSVAAGAEIWPGHMQYPIKFPKEFMEAMLGRFRDEEVPVGGKFDDPGRGSLGEFIQKKLKIKMNPAVYVAALLIEEGYAAPARRGYIRFRSQNGHLSRPLTGNRHA